MNNDKIAEIRARHAQSEKNYIELEATWKAQVHEDRATLLAEVERLRAENELQRAEIELQRTSRHREARAFEAEHNRLQAALNTARRERDEARAEVERLTEWQSINHSEQHKLGWSMTEFCEGKRDHLHEMWERPPSLDYGIAHIEAEIKRLRAHNARLRAQVSEYFSEPATHPVEREE